MMILHKERVDTKTKYGGYITKKNRLLALLLAGTLTLGLLSGCGGGTSGSSGGGTSGGGTSGSSGGGQPASGVELTVVTSYGGDDEIGRAHV